MSDEVYVPQSSTSFLTHLAAQILSGRIHSCTVSQVEISLPLLTWSRTYSTNSSYSFSGVTQGVSCHSVCKGCHVLAKALQRKHLKTRRSIIWASVPGLCNIFFLCAILVSYVLLGTVPCFPLNQVRDDIEVQGEGETHLSMKNKTKRRVSVLWELKWFKHKHTDIKWKDRQNTLKNNSSFCSMHWGGFKLLWSLSQL